MARDKKALAGRGKVLSFERDSQFYYRSGMARLDRNDLAGAMASYLMALDKEPEDPYVIMGIAELLTAMERYEQSNRLLMVRLRGREDCPAEAYFGMGCNFMATREYIQARSCFDKYLSMEPDGEFAYDAYDMAEAIDGGDVYGPGGPMEDMLRGRTELARQKLNQERYREAIELLEETLQTAPDMLSARNMLTMAYYCAGEYEKATEQAGIALRQEPENLQAHCNLALFLRGARDDLGLRRQIERLKAARPENDEDLNHVGITLLELGEPEAALPLFRQLGQRRPYDIQTQHRLALCLYYAGEYEEAGRCYGKLLRIDPADSVARYYRGLCRGGLAGAPPHKGLPLYYQVPAEEIIRRIRRMNDYIGAPLEELREQWRPGGEFYQMLVWALELPDAMVKRVALNLIGALGGSMSEYLLRDFILRRDQDNELKREAFALLKGMGAAEPYLCYIDGEFMKSWVSVLPHMPKGVPAAYRRVLEQCTAHMRGLRGDTVISAAVSLWRDYIDGLDGYRPLSGGQVTALAAALEYAACRRCGIEATKVELCSEYGVTITRFNNAMAKLERGGREN